MFAEFFHLLSDWILLDTWMVVTGALAAMSCALPGTWLLLRRQSLLGDALSHSILPGIVLAYLATYWLQSTHRISADSGVRHVVIFAGAAISGIISAVATELIQRWGRIDRSAAMGVVFTTMFAIGLLCIRMFANQVDVDPGCVLYGSLEVSAMVPFSNSIAIPRAAVINAAMLAINGILVIAFFKELRLSTFDPGLATAVGLSANGIQLVLMSITAATLVAAFESVGAILVIAMLIVPAATARLMTDRLSTMLMFSLVLAAIGAALGHVFAITLPKIVFSRLGFPEVEVASTTGMMAVASGCLFVIAIFASPRHGAIRHAIDRARLRIRIAGEDILGSLYRRDEMLLANASSSDGPTSVSAEFRSVSDPGQSRSTSAIHPDASGFARPGTAIVRTWVGWFARRNLQRRGLISISATTRQLTDQGRELARSLVRAHRLWEAYMARHFELPDDHLHSTAEQVEHFLSPQLQTQLASELDEPATDPHGKSIPGA